MSARGENSAEIDQRDHDLKHFFRFLIGVFAVGVAHPLTAWAWGSAGHEMIAIIAADSLTPAARSHIAQILGIADDPTTVARAMAASSIRPDTEFREEDSATVHWHFIDLCMQDNKGDIPARCPNGDCVTAKIDEYTVRLHDGRYDHWGASGDLAFLIHFVGDIHQPLHTINDADKGGNCVTVEAHSRDQNLHAIWDDEVVYRLEDDLHTHRSAATARILEQKYEGEKNADAWHAGSANDIAWESHQIADEQIYRALHIPLEPCGRVQLRCEMNPPLTVHLDDSYLEQSSAIAGHQLARAGFRLASLLNGIWIQPVSAVQRTGE
jgi:hypothetical protein